MFPALFYSKSVKIYCLYVIDTISYVKICEIALQTILNNGPDL